MEWIEFKLEVGSWTFVHMFPLFLRVFLFRGMFMSDINVEAHAAR